MVMEVRVRRLSAAAEDAPMELADEAQVVVVTPGQVISTETGAFLRGHGTYLSGRNELVASVAGVVDKVNQLITVRPLVSRYIGEVGDIVVGRVADVASKRWKVDVNGQQDASLMLSSVTLPGGAQRRRTYADQLQMRAFFVENDLISAEIQEVRYDGSLSLHTRSLRYGKLENGQFVAIAAPLVKRMKQHMATLPGIGIDVILGTNGYIWVSRSMAALGGDDDEDTASSSMETRVEVLTAKRQLHAATPMSVEDRRKIARVSQALLRLNEQFRMITPDSIMATYELLESQGR
ncbi:Exosome complex component RRP4 [Phytophthora pseudosyringae]|uniref:Exosome complex component RRP4 n=1 Tax=Phytophthora pseudosyringae TaxID=221518 RepID=A0A8T1V5C7_9STRA|nr:Exosome complex component RRP4 [Phytophthora pseudosyringae]